jgi:hypothetical protein
VGSGEQQYSPTGGTLEFVSRMEYEALAQLSKKLMSSCFLCHIAPSRLPEGTTELWPQAVSHAPITSDLKELTSPSAHRQIYYYSKEYTSLPPSSPPPPYRHYGFGSPTIVSHGRKTTDLTTTIETSVTLPMHHLSIPHLHPPLRNTLRPTTQRLPNTATRTLRRR